MRASNAQKSSRHIGRSNATPERRVNRRVLVSCNSLIRLDENLTFRARALNISATAVQISCDSRYALLVHPSGHSRHLDGGRLLDIAMALPDSAEEGDFKARCRVKYCVNHNSQSNSSNMVLGLQFVRMDFTAIQRLDHFIETQLSG